MWKEHKKKTLIHTYPNDTKAVQNVLSYYKNKFRHSSSEQLPLAHENWHTSVTRWLVYQHLIGRGNAFDFLRPRIVQFMFPIEAGISATDSYRKATLRGVFPDLSSPAQSLILQEPEGMQLKIYKGLAGAVPVLTIPNRTDFENITRALLYKNEPMDIPKSMGAVFLSGLVNWDKIHNYRDNWLLDNPHAQIDWPKEFESNLLPNRHLYQDRLMLLSTANDSDIPTVESHILPEDWTTYSEHIRLQHGCTHFFTKKIFGRMDKDLHDEIIADYMGITKVCGSFRSD